MNARYFLNHPERLLSPSLILFEETVRENLDTMIRLVGSPDRLRPHVKTHKMEAIVRLQESLGLSKHKVATLAEAEMVARAGGKDILIAYPMVGPNIERFANLIRTYPETTFRVLVDHPASAEALSETVERLEQPVSTLVDLDVGMGRTGIAPGDDAAKLYALIDALPGLIADGLHAYDGHLRTVDPEQRRVDAEAGMKPALTLREQLIAAGLLVPRLIIGGTPTFPIHAKSTIPGVECSPGTTTLFDAGYGTRFPDLPFVPAALLLTRVISLPRKGSMTLDLGHKAVAADPVGDRLALPDIPDAKYLGQSEEHLVVETSRAASVLPGDHFLAIPMHICPTVALHQRVYVVRKGELVDTWDVSARNRVLTI